MALQNKSSPRTDSAFERIASIDDLPEQLAAQLKLSLPGSAAQRTMEPELAYGRHFGPPRPDARPAAVVALLHRRAGQWQLPLLLRPSSLAHHAGQISLPGGTLEPGETSREAALREMEEELGIPQMDAEFLGKLSPLYVFNSNFQIDSWVATMTGDLQFVPCASEVEIILEVPLAHLLDPANRGEQVRQVGGLRWRAPHFEWRDHQIWGATAMILAELVAVFSAIFPVGAAANRTATGR